MNYVVGVDLGGTVIKASLFDEHGVQIATAGSRTPLVSDEIGQAERDIEDTRVRTFQVIRDAIAQSGVSATQIVALAPTGHGKGLYTVRRDGSAGIGIVSTDTRSHEVARPDSFRRGLRVRNLRQDVSTVLAGAYRADLGVAQSRPARGVR